MKVSVAKLTFSTFILLLRLQNLIFFSKTEIVYRLIITVEIKKDLMRICRMKKIILFEYLETCKLV